MAEFRKIETGKILCLEATGPYRDIAGMFERLTEYLQNRGVPARGEHIAVIYDDPLTADPERLHYAAALELAGEVTGDGEMTVVVQPSGWVACETHSGPRETIQDTYARLFAWVRDNGYRVTGPAREYYLSGISGDAAQTLTEIQLPIEKTEPWS